jgi:hypothetical protein
VRRGPRLASVVFFASGLLTFVAAAFFAEKALSAMLVGVQVVLA